MRNRVRGGSPEAEASENGNPSTEARAGDAPAPAPGEAGALPGTVTTTQKLRIESAVDIDQVEVEVELPAEWRFARVGLPARTVWTGRLRKGQPVEAPFEIESVGPNPPRASVAQVRLFDTSPRGLRKLVSTGDLKIELPVR